MQLNMKAATCKLAGSGINQQRAPQTMRPAATVRLTAAATIQQQLAATCVAASTASLLLLSSGAAYARQPPIQEEAGRCTIEALDKFADTRATFSLEASGGNMAEAVVDIRGCDYSNLDLKGKVLSGVKMQDSNFSGSNLVGLQFARAQAQGANLRGADLTDVNAFATAFDGADLEDAQFENAVLSNASFGQYEGRWANLKGAHFEGALLSSSDVVRVCANPTLDLYTKQAELGCRKSR